MMARRGMMDVERLNGASTVTLTGDVDAGVTKDLQEIIDSLVEEGERYVVVDMGNTGFVGNSALSVLVGCSTGIRRKRGEMKLCRVPGATREVLDLLGTGDVLPVFDDMRGALLAAPDEIRQRLGIEDRRNGERRGHSSAVEGRNRRLKDRRCDGACGPLAN